MRILLVLFGLAQLLLGVLLWFAPGEFYEEIGPFGPLNEHYMGDLATFYLALGAIAFVAVARPSWRVPVLAFALIQYTLHTVNHVLDVNESDPSWLGPGTLVALGVGAALLAWMLRRSLRT
jgi:hypothetical protein